MTVVRAAAALILLMLLVPSTARAAGPAFGAL
jgi:hypothetical protein